MVISSVDATHVPFEIVQRKVFTPVVSPVTPEVGEEGVVTVADPAITDHAPVPTTGVFPARVAVGVLHKLWFGPAADVVGFA